MKFDERVSEEARAWLDQRPRLAAFARWVVHRRLRVLTALVFLQGTLFWAFLTYPADVALFTAAGRSLLHGHWQTIFADPNIQVGPLQLLFHGAIGSIADLLHLPMGLLLAWASTATLTFAAVFVTRVLLAERGVDDPVRELLAGVFALFGGLALIGFSSGHPSEAFVAFAWVVAFGLGGNRFTLLAGAFLAGFVISWLASPHKAWALFGTYASYAGLLPYLFAVILGFTASRAFAGDAKWILRAVEVGGIAVSLTVILGAIGASPWSPVVEGTRLVDVTGTLGNTNFTGAYLALSLVVVLAHWLEQRSPRLPLLAFPPIVLALYLTSSEISWAAALAGSALVVGTHLEQTRPWMRTAGYLSASLLCAGLLGLVFVGALDTDRVPFSAAERGDWWITSAKLIDDSPWVGHGPDTFMLESTRFRSAFDAVSNQDFGSPFTPLGVRYAPSADPHSVPFALAANAGLIGGVPFIVLLIAGLATVVKAPGSGTGAALGALLATYVFLCLFTVDVIAIRTAFWVGVGVLLGPHATSLRQVEPVRGGKVAAVVAVGVSVIASLYIGGRVWSADRGAQLATAAFTRGAPQLGATLFEDAITTRGDAIYKLAFADFRGIEGLNSGAGGSDFVAEVDSNFDFLGDVPMAMGYESKGRVLHYSGHFDPAGDRAAVSVFEKAIELDPNNPLPRIELSETLLDLGRAEEAVEGLEKFESHVDDVAAPEYWAALATARIAAGDTEGAAEALKTSVEQGVPGCRATIAKELLTIVTSGPPEEPAESSLRLSVLCDEGMVDFFRDRLPPEIRQLYEQPSTSR